MSTKKKLIVIEGIDRSGKTTLVNYLTQKLNNTFHSTHNISFPNRKSLTGELINKYLSNQVKLNPQTIHLLFSANRWEMIEDIEKMEYEFILCDRYYFSGIAYTIAKDVERGWAIGPDRGLLEPDLVVFIDINADAVVKRPGFGNEKYEKVEYQRKVYKVLKELVVMHVNGVVVCGNGTVEEIGNRIYQMLMDISKD